MQDMQGELSETQAGCMFLLYVIIHFVTQSIAPRPSTPTMDGILYFIEAAIPISPKKDFHI
jgi:hypothetical protein